MKTVLSEGEEHATRQQKKGSFVAQRRAGTNSTISTIPARMGHYSYQTANEVRKLAEIRVVERVEKIFEIKIKPYLSRRQGLTHLLEWLFLPHRDDAAWAGAPSLPTTQA
jgi:hypothetical protein